MFVRVDPTIVRVGTRRRSRGAREGVRVGARGRSRGSPWAFAAT